MAEVFAETARTARETRAIPFFDCMVPAKIQIPNARAAAFGV